MSDTITESAVQQSQNPEGVTYSPVGFAALSLVGIFFLYQIVGGGIALIISGGSFSRENVTTARLSTMAAQFLFLLLPTLWLIKHQHKIIRRVVRWRIPSANELLLSIVGMVSLLQVAEGYIYFQNMIPLPESIAPFVEMLKKMIEETYKILVQSHSLPELILVIAVVALAPAICEEIFFRGLVQKNISLATNRTKGFIITGVIFGLYHFNPFLALPLVALGIYFSFLQFRSQTIILPMVAHFVNNAVSVIAVYLYGYDQADKPVIMASSSSDMTVLGSTVVFAVVFVVAIVMYIRSTEHIAKEPI